MREHRLIEQMVKIFDYELARVNETLKVDPTPILIGLDFFKTYVDKTHHGKEEAILFNALDKKPLTPEHRRIMNGLIEDHRRSRQTLAALSQATHKYMHGDHTSVATITSGLKTLTSLYPRHIATEDQHFFFPSMTYFTKNEQNAMLNEFAAFDSKVIHDYYTTRVCSLEENLRLD
jgi:hemerythrin-like domain-containing protein